MTDKEIIKALKCCISQEGNCDICPQHSKTCVDDLLKSSLDLINRQQAEIEKLQNLKTFENFIIRRIHGIGTKYECDFATKEARDEAFEKELNKLFDIATAKAEAIKEFAERLKEALPMECRNVVEGNDMEGITDTGFQKEDTITTIDNLVKEMVGEE